MNDIVCISPVDGSEVARRRIATEREIAETLLGARAAQQRWARVPLAWTGVKDTGRGASMSRLGFEAVTRPKSFHLRIEH